EDAGEESVAVGGKHQPLRKEEAGDAECRVSGTIGKVEPPNRAGEHAGDIEVITMHEQARRAVERRRGINEVAKFCGRRIDAADSAVRSRRKTLKMTDEQVAVGVEREPRELVVLGINRRWELDRSAGQRAV